MQFNVCSLFCSCCYSLIVLCDCDITGHTLLCFCLCNQIEGVGMVGFLGSSFADQEFFVRGGPTVTTFFFCLFFLQGGKGSNNSISGPSSARQRNAIFNGASLACQRWPNNDSWLGIFVIFRGIRTSIAKKPYIFYDFSGGERRGPDPLFHPSDLHMFLIVTLSQQMR